MRSSLSLIACVWLSACNTTTKSSVMTKQAQGATSGTNVVIHRELLIPSGQFARKNPEKLQPRFITIHSTQSFRRGATALSHANGQHDGNYLGENNKIGYRSWHFTVDDHSIYQSLPLDEQGQHADYEGPGNMTSIGIEMCENEGGNWAATLDSTAKLTAQLMKQYRIPISNVVPHMHWRMIRFKDGKDLGFKPCPLPLLDNGRLGVKWNAFIEKIEHYGGN